VLVKREVAKASFDVLMESGQEPYPKTDGKEFEETPHSMSGMPFTLQKRH